MEIIRGKIPHAKKFVIYGPEGIGKSTFASKFPDPVFIDTEGSTKEMDVARFKSPTSWSMVLEQIRYVRDNNLAVCKTLVVDTIDWAEAMCIEHVCKLHQKDGLESFGYGNGYVYVREEFGRFLNLLEEVVEKGVNVVLTAHAQMRKFEQPDEMGAYDRWELKLGKKTSSQTSPLVKEWSDALLFANYKTLSVAADDKGKKHKAQGGRRVMYTMHHPCWDAKNRYGLPEECEFDYAVIKAIIEPGSAVQPAPVKQKTPPPTMEHPAETSKPAAPAARGKDPQKTAATPGKQMTLPLDPPDQAVPQEAKAEPLVNPKIPKNLRDLMEVNYVDEWDIQNVVSARGYFPADMPVWDYPPDFIEGVLVGAWPQVFAMIKEMKEKQEIPFD
jgi:hypothetical protein